MCIPQQSRGTSQQVKLTEVFVNRVQASGGQWVGWAARREQRAPRNKSADRPPTSHPLSEQALGSVECGGRLPTVGPHKVSRTDNKVLVLKILKPGINTRLDWYVFSQGSWNFLRSICCALFYGVWSWFEVTWSLILHWSKQRNPLLPGQQLKGQTLLNHCAVSKISPFSHIHCSL